MKYTQSVIFCQGCFRTRGLLKDAEATRSPIPSAFSQYFWEGKRVSSNVPLQCPEAYACQCVKKKQPTKIGEAEIRMVPSSTRAREFEAVTACSSIHNSGFKWTVWSSASDAIVK